MMLSNYVFIPRPAKLNHPMDNNLLLILSGAIGAIGTKVFDYVTKKDDMKMTQSEKLRSEFKAEMNLIQADVTKWQTKYFEVYDNLLKAQNNNLAIQEKYNLVTEKYNLVTEKYNDILKKYDALQSKVRVLEGQAAGTVPSTPNTGVAPEAAHIITSVPVSIPHTLGEETPS